MGGGGNSRVFHNIFNKIISLDNLYLAWREFVRGKRSRSDVQEFEFNLEENILNLHHDLKNKKYQHSNYTSFYICDPKLRNIHKAEVRDRVLHHAIFRTFNPIFDKSFIFDSYSCRKNKGTHKGVNRLECFIRKVSNNHHNQVYALKCDIKKFFDSIDHNILFDLIKKKVQDSDTLWLIQIILNSFYTKPEKGLPLGNVISQLFANIYMNKFDQFIKHVLKEKYYIRYSDDFVILHQDRNHLRNIIQPIQDFLSNNLQLSLHPNKLIIRKTSHGIDFLGYVALPSYRVIRTKTKRRILRKIKLLKQELNNKLITEESFNQSLQSYLGILKHCDGYKVRKKVEEIIKDN